MSLTLSPTDLNFRTHLLGVFCAFAGFSCFAIGDASYKWLMQSHTFFLILFLGSVAAIAMMSLYIPFGGGLKLLKTSVPKLQIARTLVISTQFLLSIYSIRYLPLPIFYTIAFTAPCLSAIMGRVILKESVSKGNWLAIIIGLVGVFIALKPWTSFYENGFSYEPIAVLGILAASVFLSGSQILARIIGQKSQDSGFTTAYYPIFFVLILSGYMYFSTPDMPALSSLRLSEYLLVIIAALGGVGGNVLLAIGFAKAPPALAAPFHYSQIIWAMIFGVFVFGDKLDPAMLIGVGLVITSGIYLVTHRFHSKRQIEDEPTITQL